MPNMRTGNSAPTPGAAELAKVHETQQRILSALAKAEEDATYTSWEEYEEERSKFLLLRNSLKQPPAPHGTRARYQRGKCRCADCTRANTEYQRQRSRAKGAQEQRVTHGLPGTYANGCRCDECRAAGKAYRDARKARAVDKSSKAEEN